jgi:hypothetical protein
MEYNPMRTAAGATPVTVSIAVAGVESIAHASRDSMDALLGTPDRCLYRSKEGTAIA